MDGGTKGGEMHSRCETDERGDMPLGTKKDKEGIREKDSQIR
jgi:hypothetical protein